ncbi:MAG: DUF1573 domain-containing protein, partial [Euryarchaeota archaeon]|nr:DUF1573 domain-containing protein [Euryarchaeota archaeon]
MRGYLAFLLAGMVLGGSAFMLLSRTVSAAPPDREEIYELFQCPCCGQPISAGCCELAVERQAYADGLIDAGLGKEEVILRYIERYGIDSFRNDNLREEYRRKLLEKAPENRPVVEAEATEIDLGEVSVAEGTVVREVRITNAGKKELELFSLYTSCSCTTASLVYRGYESERYGMEAGSINVALEPGESA